MVSCSDDASFEDHFACFVETALQLGNPVIVVANESHRTQLARNWKRMVGRLRPVFGRSATPPWMSAKSSRRLWSMIGRTPRNSRKWLEISSWRQPNAQSRNLRMLPFAEHTHDVVGTGQSRGSNRVERVWDCLVGKYGFQVLCGYVLTDSQIQQDHHIFGQICALHSAAYFLQKRTSVTFDSAIESPGLLQCPAYLLKRSLLCTFRRC